MNWSRDLSEMNEINDVKVKINKLMFSATDCFIKDNATPDKQLIPCNMAIGTVSEVFNSSSSRFSRMERVVIEPFIPCNDCRFCKRSQHTDCIAKQSLGINSDGLLRDFISLPHSCLYSVPEVVTANDAILTPALSLALNILDKIALEKGEHLAVFGGGIMGVILACLANYYQAMPIFVESDEEIIKTALGKNVFYTFNNQKEDVTQKVFSITGGRKCEKVVYLSDGKLPVSLALENCAQNGIFCVYSIHHQDLHLPMSYVVQNNLTINSVENCFGNFPTALNLLTKNIVKFDDFASKELPFASLDQTLPEVTEGQTLRENVIIKCE